MINSIGKAGGNNLDNCNKVWKVAVAVIVSMCFVFATTICSAAPKEKKPLTDQQIANAVDRALLTDSALLNNQIDTEVSDGIVTLSGTANNLIARERAIMIAETIRGARSVVNLITLAVSSRSDDELRNDVSQALLYDQTTDSYELTPEVKDGVVTLNGTAQSYREKQLSVSVAKGVKGVIDVKDNIILSSKDSRTDSEIIPEVRNVLSNDVWLAASAIEVDVKDGVVTLTGKVGSSALRNRASLLAWTAGVKSVNAEGLRIDPWANSGSQREKGAAVSDVQIRQAVHDALLYDPRVFSFNPVIDVDNGAVTLTGIVDNLRAKRAAEQDANNTVGVWRVKNQLKVRPTTSVADDMLALTVISALGRDTVVGGYEINVKTRNGVVTLVGTVDTYYEKAKAEDVASRANGAVNVINNIAVVYPERVFYNLGYDPSWDNSPFYSYWEPNRPQYFSSDSAIKADIEDTMYWNPSVDLYDITVKVANGVATLSGTAGSWFEFNKATEIAYEGGARLVYNNIEVK